MGAFLNFLPIFVLLVIVGFGAFIGYQMYLWSNEMAERGKQKLEKKNVSFSKDGMKVGVREINDEEYADKTQGYLVKAWNYSSFPAYKSRFWNTEAQGASSKSSSSSTGSNIPRAANQRSGK